MNSGKDDTGSRRSVRFQFHGQREVHYSDFRTALWSASSLRRKLPWTAETVTTDCGVCGNPSAILRETLILPYQELWCISLSGRHHHALRRRRRCCVFWSRAVRRPMFWTDGYTGVRDSSMRCKPTPNRFQSLRTSASMALRGTSVSRKSSSRDTSCPDAFRCSPSTYASGVPAVFVETHRV